MADTVHGDTQVGATKQEIISAIAQRELKFKAKLLPYFTDVSQFAGKGMKSISFPKLGSFTVQERASGTAGNATVITATNDTLELNIPAYIAYIFDPNDVVQSTVNWQSEAAKRSGGAHGRYVDTKIIAELINVAGLTAQAVAGDITEADILKMRKYLLKNEAIREDLVLIIDPDQEEAMLKIDKFVRADMYGSSNIPDGVIGRVYGIPVVVHNGMVVGQAVMAEKGGLAVGFQLGPNSSEQPANEYGSQAMRTAIDQLFGVKGMQIAQGSAAAGKSALVAKLQP